MLLSPASDILLKKWERGGVMTLWHVQKLYVEDKPVFVVLPYHYNWRDMKIENSYKATIMFLWGSRLSEAVADKFCKKKNEKLWVE